VMEASDPLFRHQPDYGLPAVAPTHRVLERPRPQRSGRRIGANDDAPQQPVSPVGVLTAFAGVGAMGEGCLSAVHAIDVLNEELIAAGARLLACGLSGPSHAKSLRAQPNGEVLITDGPYLEAKEHIGGFWILEAADMDEALAWARKAVKAGGQRKAPTREDASTV
jgi:hypothetical protein